MVAHANLLIFHHDSPLYGDVNPHHQYANINKTRKKESVTKNSEYRLIFKHNLLEIYNKSVFTLLFT